MRTKFFGLLLALSLSLAISEDSQQRSTGTTSILVPNSDVTAIMNMVTSFFLLSVVWIILAPLLSGSVVITKASDRMDTTYATTPDEHYSNQQYYETQELQEEPQYSEPDLYAYGTEFAGYQPEPIEQEQSPNQYLDDYYQAYRSFPGTNGRQQGGWWESAQNTWNSIDVVDTTFDLMKIESDVCRQRAVCELEGLTADSPTMKMLFKAASTYVSGLSKYRTEKEGREADCSVQFDGCPYSLRESLTVFDKIGWNLWPLGRK